MYDKAPIQLPFGQIGSGHRTALTPYRSPSMAPFRMRSSVLSSISPCCRLISEERFSHTMFAHRGSMTKNTSRRVEGCDRIVPQTGVAKHRRRQSQGQRASRSSRLLDRMDEPARPSSPRTDPVSRQRRSGLPHLNNGKHVQFICRQRCRISQRKSCAVPQHQASRNRLWEKRPFCAAGLN